MILYKNVTNQATTKVVVGCVLSVREYEQLKACDACEVDDENRFMSKGFFHHCIAKDLGFLTESDFKIVPLVLE